MVISREDEKILDQGIVITVDYDYDSEGVYIDEDKLREDFENKLEALMEIDICKCGFEFGLDDGGEAPYDKSWERYREKWLTKDLDYSQTKNMTRDQKLKQLKNIGL